MRKTRLSVPTQMLADTKPVLRPFSSIKSIKTENFQVQYHREDFGGRYEIQT